MVEKYNIRTDLALEEKERFESDHVEVQGVEKQPILAVKKSMMRKMRSASRP